MTHTPHELAEEFPELIDVISDLRQTNRHFARLADAYHVINRSIHRAETNVSPTNDENMQKMRRERLVLKDQIYAFAKAHEAALTEANGCTS